MNNALRNKTVDSCKDLLTEVCSTSLPWGKSLKVQYVMYNSYPSLEIIHFSHDFFCNSKGGFKSREEMCLTFIGYYPALNVSRCWTFPLRENLVKVTNITEWKRYVLPTSHKYFFI